MLLLMSYFHKDAKLLCIIKHKQMLNKNATSQDTLFKTCICQS